ncbi:hypothetical protein IB276_26005 [Ensifer sp. ENS04]|uniref:hypothetical protein n=1 Tax=Ensifer sp. ENS04 TaxID=2769281 RepID=UPI0017860A2B|nr:hypothetical protein [Ensifer sp. ENS04]MBD9542904.1 hypothetical protein [Ensifer sp. ENS04]
MTGHRETILAHNAAADAKRIAVTKEMIDAGAKALAERNGSSRWESFQSISEAVLSAALSRPIDPKAEVEAPLRSRVATAREAGDEAYKRWRGTDASLDGMHYIAFHIVRALSASPSIVAVHPDDLAVDSFAAAMKAKLAKKRAEGRGGWENPSECSIAYLSELLRDHVNKGDPVDVGNLAMMIQQRGGVIE